MLQPEQMVSRFAVTGGHQFGQGQHQSVPRLHQVAIPVRDRLFQLRIGREQVQVQRVGAVLSLFEPQRGSDA